VIRARDFIEAASRFGYNWYAGVPCSFLTPFINCVIQDPHLTYVSSPNEGDAVAAAAGAWIGGVPSVAMMQNSGLGNAVSPLTSLTHIFRIPILVICTHRGAPGVEDEPQHELMGKITGRLLDTMDIPTATFPRDRPDIEPTLKSVEEYTAVTRRPYALVMEKDTCEPHPLAPNTPKSSIKTASIDGRGHERYPPERIKRAAALRLVVDATTSDNTVLIATTGYTGRELYSIADRSNHLYMVGSMGCGSSLGLGLALARPDLRVIVIDGDGAALMRLGNLATAGAYAPPNFVHLLLDNEAHESTGAQATVSARTDFASIAAACGYQNVTRTDSLEDLATFLGKGEGSQFMHMKIQTGVASLLPRPELEPQEVLNRLMKHIGGKA